MRYNIPNFLLKAIIKNDNEILETENNIRNTRGENQEKFVKEYIELLCSKVNKFFNKKLEVQK